MFKILSKEQLNSETCLVEFHAPDIAAAAGPGQFLVLRVDEKGERFPLTIHDMDPERGTVSVVCQAVGVSTRKLCSLGEGGHVADIAGPLGHRVSGAGYGKVIVVGGGVGVAEAYPVARLFAGNGSEVEVIAGFRTKELVLCEKELKEFCREVHVTTDDGSYGRKGFVTDVLGGLLTKKKYDLAFVVGPVAMMKAVSGMTLSENLETRVSLNALMVDGTGMCGCCRILYGGEKRFACYDGPDFDASKVDFEDLGRRVSSYVEKERQALEHKCRIGLVPPSAGRGK
ncbi:MAG: sulfide/dihydroorotate dehydrogenase-like FAD/NAD-binding protein [Candidatus Omnitrophica bacterium]|nr:sulfide/dihydroorotate dehydrogenase-like FAD/NAD-binding protein [Candidatus Omnitrophota bacterium]